MAAEAGRVRHGASVDEATAILDDRLRGRRRRVPGLAQGAACPCGRGTGRRALRHRAAAAHHDVVLGAQFYPGPRTTHRPPRTSPGRSTWWRLATGIVQNLGQLTTVFARACPVTTCRWRRGEAADSLSRYAKCTFISGHARARPFMRSDWPRARLVDEPGTGWACSPLRRCEPPAGHRHRRAPGPAAAGRVPVDLREGVPGTARARPRRAGPGARRGGALFRLARPGDRLQAGRTRLARGPGGSRAAPWIRLETLAHRRAQPWPDRPGQSRCRAARYPCLERGDIHPAAVRLERQRGDAGADLPLRRPRQAPDDRHLGAGGRVRAVDDAQGDIARSVGLTVRPVDTPTGAPARRT